MLELRTLCKGHSTTRQEYIPTFSFTLLILKVVLIDFKSCKGLNYFSASTGIVNSLCPFSDPLKPKVLLFVYCTHNIWASDQGQKVNNMKILSMIYILSYIRNYNRPRPLDKRLKLKINFFFLNQNICCGYLKEPSLWHGSFEHPKQILQIMDQKIFTILLQFFSIYLDLPVWYGMGLCQTLFKLHPNHHHHLIQSY